MDDIITEVITAAAMGVDFVTGNPRKEKLIKARCTKCEYTSIRVLFEEAERNRCFKCQGKLEILAMEKSK